MGNKEPCGDQACHTFPGLDTTITVNDYSSCGYENPAILPLHFTYMSDPANRRSLSVSAGSGTFETPLITFNLSAQREFTADPKLEGVVWNSDRQTYTFIDGDPMYGGFITLNDGLRKPNGTVNLDYKPGDRYEIRVGDIAGCGWRQFKVFFTRLPKSKVNI